MSASKFWHCHRSGGSSCPIIGDFLQYGWIEYVTLHFGSQGSNVTVAFLKPVVIPLSSGNSINTPVDKGDTGHLDVTGRYSKAALEISPESCRYVRLSGFQWTPTLADEFQKFLAEKGLLVGLICGNRVLLREDFHPGNCYSCKDVDFCLAFFYGKIDPSLCKEGKTVVGGQTVTINDSRIAINLPGMTMAKACAPHRPPRMDDAWFLQFCRTFGPTAKSFASDLSEEDLRAMLWEIYTGLPYDLRPAAVPCERQD